MLPAYMVPSAFVALDRMPLTPNGKLDRAALPAPVLVPEEGDVPADDTVEVVREIWEEVLGLDLIGDDESLFELGGHSLTIARIAARDPRPARRRRAVLRVLRRADRGRDRRRRRRSPDRTVNALSAGQRRLWFLQRLDPADASYNMPVALRIRGRLDEAALEAALTTIAAAARRAARALRRGRRREPGPAGHLGRAGPGEDQSRRRPWRPWPSAPTGRSTWPPGRSPGSP